MPKKIVVIGSSNVDMIMKMDRLPKVGETITDAEFVQTFGGKGANQAMAAVRAGGDVAFVNCVGEDIYADIMIHNFQKEGMETNYIFKEKGIPSGTALVMIGDEGTNYLSVAPGANYKLSPSLLDKSKDIIKEAALIIIQLEIPIDTTHHILEIANELGIKVMFNLAPVQPFDLEYLKYVHYFIVNETETEAITGIIIKTQEDIKFAAEQLLKKGPKVVIITLGADGSYICSKDLKQFIPCFKVKAVDTTAAGDTFCGSLGVALVDGKDLIEAVIFATAASALSVTRLGAQPSIPTRKETDEFLKINHK